MKYFSKTISKILSLATAGIIIFFAAQASAQSRVYLGTDNTGTASSEADANAAEIGNPSNTAQIERQTQWNAISKKNLPAMPEAPVEAMDLNAIMQPERCGFMECLPMVPLQDDVYYTVSERVTVSQQAAMWGVPSNVLTALNDNLSPETILTPEQKLLADARLASEPVPYSRGKSSRGRLYHGRLMPEGEGYFLRSSRPRSWGTDTTIQSLMTVFHAYHETFPGAHPINVGDISKRRGGKIKPHASHQSGRDVDLGFVHTVGPDEHHPEHFIRANADNLDVEKTWFIVESLIRTGNVKTIYVDRTVMAMLYAFASKNLSPRQKERIFSNPRHENSAASILQHWPGHRNHLHVRFYCPPEQPGCRN